MEQETGVEAALVEAGFRRVAHVRVSHRVSDIVASRPDVGLVLLRCVLSPTSTDIKEAAEMVAAGDFNTAVVAYKTAAASEIQTAPNVRLCSLDDVSQVLVQLPLRGTTELPH